MRLRLEYVLCSHICTLRGRVEFSETVPTDHGLIPIYVLTKGLKGFEIKNGSNLQNEGS